MHARVARVEEYSKYPGINWIEWFLRWKEKKLKFVAKSSVVYTTVKQVIVL